MKKYKNYIVGIGILIFGIILGNVFSGGDSESSYKESAHEYELVQDPVTQLWTCAMHPQIKMEEPGNCPICGMELIPLQTTSDSDKISNTEIVLSEEAYQLGNIQTSVVEKANATKEIHLLGKVQPDERYLFSQVSHIPGRIERLYVNFTGEKVLKGQKIAHIYSPELISAQKELFEAIRSKSVYPALYTASRNKLKLWKLSDNQIDAIENSGSIQEQIDILSDYSGYVMKRNVELGDYLKEGTLIFDIANLNTVWVMFDAYEADIQWIHINDKVDFTIEAMPGTLYKGKITNIDPFVSPTSRITQVRVEVPNPSNKLLPEMFANGTIKANLKGTEDALVIPKTAVLWTGKKSIVYVKVPHENTISFSYREIILGADLGEFYIVKDGLTAGEIVATNGVFKIDASAQLIGQQSMMNPPSKVYNIDGMANMPEMVMDNENTQSTSKTKINDEELKTGNRAKMNIPKEFQNQLNNVLIKYLDLKDALTKDNGIDAQKFASDLLKAVNVVDMKLLSNSTEHTNWMTISKEISTAAAAIAKTSNIEIQRANFKPLSLNLIKAVKLFGINTKVYEQFCPMADDNDGGYWLSLTEKIYNPYFGAKMLTCGTTESVIE